MDPYVRRAALLAAGQLLASLPPPRVAAALLSAQGGAIQGGSLPLVGGSRGGGEDGGLLERLEWVQGWVRGVAGGDADETCRMMAEACVNIQAGVANAALQALQQQQQQQQQSGGGIGPVPLVMPGGAGWSGTSLPGISIGSTSSARGGGRPPLMVEIASLHDLGRA